MGGVSFIKGKPGVCILHACIWLLCAGSAVAGALPDSAILPKAEPLPTFPRDETTPLPPLAPPPANDAVPDDQDLRITVTAFHISGNQHIASPVLLAVLQPYLGKPMTLNQLNAALQAINLCYREHGFLLAQAYFPEQDVQQGQIKIAILEGALGSLRLQAPGNLDQGFLQGMASHDFASGDTIRDDNLVRNLMLINALPGLDARAELSPGEKVGSSDAAITVTALPSWSGRIAANNYGNRYTGRNMLQAGMAINNLADRGDQLYANLRSSEAEGQRGALLAYTIPVNHAGTLLNVSYSYTDYQLGGRFKPLQANGSSHYVALYADHPLYRDNRLGITARAGASYKKIEDRVDAFSLQNDRHISALDLGLFADWRGNQPLDASYQLGLTVKSGQLSFDDAVAQSLDRLGGDTRGDFLRYNLLA